MNRWSSPNVTAPNASQTALGFWRSIIHAECSQDAQAGQPAEGAETRNVEGKAYATGWYGLSRLAAMSVAIRRLIQAEQQLPAMIDAVIAGKASAATTVLLPLPAYHRAQLCRLSVARQLALLEFYRRTVMADGNRNSSNS